MISQNHNSVDRLTLDDERKSEPDQFKGLGLVRNIVLCLQVSMCVGSSCLTFLHYELPG